MILSTLHKDTMKFKSKPIKVEQDSGCTSSGSDMDITEAGQRFSVVASSERGSLDIAEAMRSLSPLPRSSIAQQSLPIKQPLDDSLSDLEQNNNPSLTKLPSPSPISKFKIFSFSNFHPFSPNIFQHFHYLQIIR